MEKSMYSKLLKTALFCLMIIPIQMMISCTKNVTKQNNTKVENSVSDNSMNETKKEDPIEETSIQETVSEEKIEIVEMPKILLEFEKLENFENSGLRPLLQNKLYVDYIDSRYVIISNLHDLGDLFELPESYVIGEYEFSNDKGWWALLDSHTCSIAKFKYENIIIGYFEVIDDFFIFNQGTSSQRSLLICDLKSDFCKEFSSYGDNSIIFNRSKNRIAISVLTNKDFFEGVDPYNKARLGIEVINMLDNSVDRYYPDKDENYELHAFTDKLVYSVNGEKVEIPY